MNIMKLLAKKGITRLWLILLITGLSMVTGSALSYAVSIGENYGGGIVFYVDKTEQHGLVASRLDMAGHSEDYPEGYFKWEDAKAECYALNENGYTDWYLPNKSELNKLYLKRNIVGGFLVDTYWSSTPSSADIAWLQAFRDGSQWDHGKSGYAYRVRAIRAF
jgi:hypothetical protein